MAGVGNFRTGENIVTVVQPQNDGMNRTHTTSDLRDHIVGRAIDGHVSAVAVFIPHSNIGCKRRYG